MDPINPVSLLYTIEKSKFFSLPGTFRRSSGSFFPAAPAAAAQTID